MPVYSAPASPRYNPPVAPRQRPSGLAGLWRAHPHYAPRQTWPDLIGINNGALTNMAANSPDSGWSGTTWPGGLAEMRFDGVDDVVVLPQNYPASTYTWIFTLQSAIASDGTTNRQVFVNGTDNEAMGFSWDFSPAYQSTWFHRDGGGTYNLAQYTSVLLPNRYYRLALTYNGSLLQTYRDGVADTAIPLSSAMTPSGAVYFGQAAAGDGQWPGSLDDIRVYTRALTPAEIWEDYRGALLGTFYPSPRRFFFVPASAAGDTTLAVTPARVAWGPQPVTLFAPPTGGTPTPARDIYSYEIGDTLRLYLQTTNPDTGGAADAISEPIASVVPQSQISVTAVDSQETVSENGLATRALDGNSLTHWHTRYTPSDDPLPHTLTLDLGTRYHVDGLRYLPRQDGGTNGTVAGYEIYTSLDGSTWGSAVATGTFASDTTEKTVRFAVTVARYVRFVATSEINGNPWTSAAEINVYGTIPTWRIYEEKTETPVTTGVYTPFDTANTDGFYTAEVALDAALGFEPGKIYVVRSAWTIYDASQVELEQFTLTRSAVTITPARVEWQAQALTTGRQILTLTPARVAWRAQSVLNANRLLTLTPARVVWRAQGILGRVLAVSAARWEWQAPTARSQTGLVIPPAKVRWQAPAQTIIFPFPTGSPIPALGGFFVGGDWLIQSTRLQLKLSLAYNPDGTWEHRLVDISDIDMAVAPGGGLATVANMAFSVAEDGTGQSMLQRWRRFATIGGTADITLDFRASDGTLLRIFTGIIDTISLRNGRSQVQCVDESIQRNLQLPQTLVTSNLYVLAASAALTQPLPLVYGYGSHLHAAPLLLTNTSQLGYTAAAHAMSLTSQVAFYNQDAQVFMPGTVSAQVVPNTATLFLSSPLQQQILNTHSGAMALLSQQNVTFATAAIDGNPATIARVYTSSVASNLDGQGFLAVYATPTSNQRGNNQAVITLTNHRRALASDPTVTGQFLVQTVDVPTGQVLRSALFTTQNFRHSLNPQTTVQTVPNLALGEQEAVEVLLYVRNEGGVGGVSNFYEVEDIRIQTGFQPTGDNFPIYLTGDFNGRRDGSGTVTPDGANTLYTLPNHIIGSLLADELGLSLSDTIQGANTTYVQRGLTFAGGIGYGWHVGRATARQILDDAARQALAILAPDREGAWGLRPFDASAQAVLTFNEQTILCEDGAPDAAANDATEVILGNMDKVHCRFEVHYAWNTGSQKFDHLLYAYESGSNAPNRDDLRYRCQLSAIRYGITEPLIVNAYWISEPSTALALLEHLVTYFSFQRVFLTFTTTLRALPLTLGDLCTITHPMLPEGDTGGTFEIHSWRVSPLAGRVTLTCSKRATVYLEYWRIKDQAGVTWYWWFDEAGQLVRDHALPNIPPLTSVDIGGDLVAPSWHQVRDESGGFWYLYPDSIGQLVIDSAPPALGQGKDVGSGITAIGLNARRYRLTASGSPQEIQLEADVT